MKVRDECDCYMEKLKLTDRQRIIFEQCLNAVVNGPFIPDGEFQTLMGLDRKEVAFILVAWSEINHESKNVQFAINNALNNLLGYPIDYPEQWNKFISIDEKELAGMFAEWRQNSGRQIDQEGYFDNLE